jgi:hypothetical protein
MDGEKPRLALKRSREKAAEIRDGPLSTPPPDFIQSQLNPVSQRPMLDRRARVEAGKSRHDGPSDCLHDFHYCPPTSRRSYHAEPKGPEAKGETFPAGCRRVESSGVDWPILRTRVLELVNCSLLGLTTFVNTMRSYYLYMRKFLRLLSRSM